MIVRPIASEWKQVETSGGIGHNSVPTFAGSTSIHVAAIPVLTKVRGYQLIRR